jgi:hypothetical protein
VTDHNFTTTFLVSQTPDQVFAAINDVRQWWAGDIEGSTDKMGDEFTYRYEDVHYSKQRITESVPGRKVVWHVTDATIASVSDQREWKGTDVTFEITIKGDKTELRFTHVGLVPELECFEDCSDAWGFFVKSSLRSLITTGKGQQPVWE